jgi:predicted nucleic acid-binding Zn ribbon protein
MNYFTSASHNGAPLMTRAKHGLLALKLSGIDYEDFRQTMLRAKAAGKITDGPKIYRTPVKPRTKPKVLHPKTCVVCGTVFHRPAGSIAKTCGAPCTGKLRTESALARAQFARTRGADCVVCATPFQPAAPSQLTCSHKCRATYRATYQREQRKL